MTDKLFTLNEAAVFLGLPEDEVRRLVEAGEIPAYQVGGAFLRFKEEQLTLFKSRHSNETVTSTEKMIEDSPGKESFVTKFFDFFYFSDFYIISAALVVLLIYIIIKSIK